MNKKSLVIAATAAALFTSGVYATTSQNSNSGNTDSLTNLAKNSCKGTNSCKHTNKCKGTNVCKGTNKKGNNSCKGTNSCKHTNSCKGKSNCKS